jgi:hypothetical protein
MSLDAANMSVRATRSARTLACRLDTRVETLRIKGLQCIRKLSDIGPTGCRNLGLFGGPDGLERTLKIAAKNEADVFG